MTEPRHASLPRDKVPAASPSTAQRAELHEHNHRTAAEYPAQALIHELFEAQVRRAPGAIATLYGEQELTYEQLNRRANRLAHQLLERGVQPDDRVGLYTERGIEEIIGLLAILKAGAAYVPLDPSYPPERLHFMLDDTSPVAILAPSSLSHQVTSLASSTPLLLVSTEEPQAASHDPHVPRLHSRQLAYIIHTSGSTGRPKGVMVEHRSVVRLVINSNCVPVGPTDCIAHCASPSFDATTWEVWAPLLNGARLLIVPQAVVLEPAALNAALVRHRVTALFLTVGLFHEYVDELEAAFSGLRYLLTGGDVTNPACVRRALTKATPPQCLINVYGPTETTTFATAFAIPPTHPGITALPIGRPITNTSVYILDQHGRPVPMGGVGEIYIGGPGVARGYLDHPTLTTERFVLDPFEPSEGARMYRTGDLGQWRADGNIEFLGRNDLQVKIRGYRIEPGEIEAVLRSQHGVKDALVVAREDTPGEKRLVAYVVSEDRSRKVGADTLRAQLKAVLPDHLVPSAIVSMPSLPLTVNGKPDRRALPAPVLADFVSQHYEPPRGELERALAELWQALLRLERIGRQDNFFELGGDSLTVFKLSAAIERRFGIKLYAHTIFGSPAFIDMVAAIATARSATTEAAVEPAVDFEHGVL
ncbi:non-ribosomal peptide synthetase [Peristeroidobacter soli]|jgi:amino acid adenylation domain-containing protein|uniref:non-ribosomal peptide synthetase n=1 Tax=Peristeroidobacter soli TaxID=2497877 RepID=UPI00158B4558|nr:non-ribosomal peptide synthetase [Peristeroidobacter soli]